MLCNRQALYTCRTLLWFPFSKDFFFSHLTFVSPLPHVHYVFVHLLKIKAHWTVWGSFECGRAEKLPVFISKFRFVCSGLCVLRPFQFFFPFKPPRPLYHSPGPTSSNVYIKTTRLFTNECRSLPDAILHPNISGRNISS